jgi:ATP-dependent Clp protease ATP-binding subunit ClpX
VVEAGGIHEELQFALRDWLRSEDLFDYGMSPQFLSRFESVVLLEDLSIDELVRIFLDTPESAYRRSRAWFEGRGVRLALSPAAARRIAREAKRQGRLGARALHEVFRRVIRDYEFDPDLAVQATGAGGTLLIDEAEVEKALG